MLVFKMTLLTLLLTSVTSQASIKMPRTDSLKNIEMWCGTPASKGRTDFPYLAAIRNVKGKKGKTTKVVTIYKNGKPVMKDYVSKSLKGSATSYTNPGQDFKLNLNSPDSPNGLGEFRAVLHEKDGDTLIENGQISCHRQKT